MPILSYNGFDSNNKLHRNIRGECKLSLVKSASSTKSDALTPTLDEFVASKDRKAQLEPGSSTTLPIVNSRVDSDMDKGTGYGFRCWHHVTVVQSLQKMRRPIPY